MNVKAISAVRNRLDFSSIFNMGDSTVGSRQSTPSSPAKAGIISNPTLN